MKTAVLLALLATALAAPAIEPASSRASRPFPTERPSGERPSGVPHETGHHSRHHHSGEFTGSFPKPTGSFGGFPKPSATLAERQASEPASRASRPTNFPTEHHSFERPSGVAGETGRHSRHHHSGEFTGSFPKPTGSFGGFPKPSATVAARQAADPSHESHASRPFPTAHESGERPSGVPHETGHHSRHHHSGEFTGSFPKPTGSFGGFPKPSATVAARQAADPSHESHASRPFPTAHESGERPSGVPHETGHHSRHHHHHSGEASGAPRPTKSA